MSKYKVATASNYESLKNSKTMITKDHGGGSTRKLFDTHKAGGSLIANRSGNQVFKQETNSYSSNKVKVTSHGTTIEYQTSVKVIKVQKVIKTATFQSQNKASGGGKSSVKFIKKS